MSHAHDRRFSPSDAGDAVRPKRLSGPRLRAERVERDEAVARGAELVRDAMSSAAVSREQLARRLGQAKGRLDRKLDPDDTSASVTIVDMIHSRMVSPRLFRELVRALDELDGECCEPPLSRDVWCRQAVVLMGRLLQLDSEIGALDSAARRKMDRAWADLEHAARQARRDLKRSP